MLITFPLSIFAKKSEHQAVIYTVVIRLIKMIIVNEKPQAVSIFSFTMVLIYNPQYLTILLTNYISRVTSLKKTYKTDLHTIALDICFSKIQEYFC